MTNDQAPKSKQDPMAKHQIPRQDPTTMIAAIGV
jgi:hypothetical protein